jgi:hypothetical protein
MIYQMAVSEEWVVSGLSWFDTPLAALTVSFAMRAFRVTKPRTARLGSAAKRWMDAASMTDVRGPG